MFSVKSTPFHNLTSVTVHWDNFGPPGVWLKVSPLMWTLFTSGKLVLNDWLTAPIWCEHSRLNHSIKFAVFFIMFTKIYHNLHNDYSLEGEEGEERGPGESILASLWPLCSVANLSKILPLKFLLLHIPAQSTSVVKLYCCTCIQ